jgi:5-methylcytosine-specific restriction endonuclease McrA
MALTAKEEYELANAARHRAFKKGKTKKARKKHPGKHPRAKWTEAARSGPVTVILAAPATPKPKKSKPASNKPNFDIPAYTKGMASEAFYKTREWMELRYSTIARYGNQCQCCGAHKSATLWLHIDHIKPRSKYPDLELNPDNLQVLCRECNIGKSNKHEQDWR